jgi:hypothetical protein
VEDSHMLLDAEVPVSIVRQLRLARYASKETFQVTPT